ncbi:MAG: hypothetical protein Q8P18_31745 [Pseudomonadota bacterium]|nr:hypothetical protein [Pseudomonadota bacterium]
MHSPVRVLPALPLLLPLLLGSMCEPKAPRGAGDTDDTVGNETYDVASTTWSGSLVCELEVYYTWADGGTNESVAEQEYLTTISFDDVNVPEMLPSLDVYGRPFNTEDFPDGLVHDADMSGSWGTGYGYVAVRMIVGNPGWVDGTWGCDFGYTMSEAVTGTAGQEIFLTPGDGTLRVESTSNMLITIVETGDQQLIYATCAGDFAPI